MCESVLHHYALCRTITQARRKCQRYIRKKRNEYRHAFSHKTAHLAEGMHRGC